MNSTISVKRPDVLYYFYSRWKSCFQLIILDLLGLHKQWQTQENNEVSTKFRHALQGYSSSRSRNNMAGIFRSDFQMAKMEGDLVSSCNDNVYVWLFGTQSRDFFQCLMQVSEVLVASGFMLLLFIPTKRGVKSPEKTKTKTASGKMMLFSISNHVDAVNMMKYGDIGDLFSNNSESSKWGNFWFLMLLYHKFVTNIKKRIFLTPF